MITYTIEIEAMSTCPRVFLKTEVSLCVLAFCPHANSVLVL